MPLFILVSGYVTKYSRGVNDLSGLWKYNGLVMGLDFWGIKLTLYYMSFYFAGYMYRQMEEELAQMKLEETVKEVAIAGCLPLWFFLMNRYNFYSIGDSGFGIIMIRATASLAGCIAICGLVSRLCDLKPSTENEGGCRRLEGM